MSKLTAPQSAISYDSSVRRKGYVRRISNGLEHVNCGQPSFKSCPFYENERCKFRSGYVTKEGQPFSFSDKDVYCGIGQ